jgi:hypothetical protein
MDAKKEIRLGGRVFVPTQEDDMTFDQFAWIQTASEKAGLGRELMGIVEPMLKKVLETEEAVTDDEAEDLTARIVSRCYEQRAHLDVLSGLLVEKGKQWSPDHAEEMKKVFGGLKGKDDIAKANAVLAEAILSFFWNGLASTRIFQNSSKTPDLVIRLQEAMESEPDQEEDLAISGL